MRQVLVMLLLFPCVSFADHICTNSPNEVYVGNTPAGQGQASMPVCRWVLPSEQQVQTPSPKPPPIVIERWHVADDRFSSFAYDNDRGPYGFVSGYESQAAADAAAMTQCQNRGGQNCSVQAQYKNMCATFAWGGGRASIQGEKTRELSERRAIDKCEALVDVKCDVIETVCSEPVYRVVDEKPDDFVPAD